MLLNKLILSPTPPTEPLDHLLSLSATLPTRKQNTGRKETRKDSPLSYSQVTTAAWWAPGGRFSDTQDPRTVQSLNWGSGVRITRFKSLLAMKLRARDLASLCLWWETSPDLSSHLENRAERANLQSLLRRLNERMHIMPSIASGQGLSSKCQLLSSPLQGVGSDDRWDGVRGITHTTPSALLIPTSTLWPSDPLLLQDPGHLFENFFSNCAPPPSPDQ